MMPFNSRREFIKASILGATVSWARPFHRALGVNRGGEEKERFLKAAHDGDLETVRRLLSLDSSLLDCRDRVGRSAFALAHLNQHDEVGDHLLASNYQCDLHEAALAGDWTRLNALAAEDVEERANGDHPIGGTVMYAAALGGAGSATDRVYSIAGDPNTIPVDRQRAPLQCALRYVDLEVAEMTSASLLANSADPNRFGKADFPPLHIAVERGSLEMIDMLIRCGAEVEALDDENRTALDLADELGLESVYTLLENHSSIPRTHSTSRLAYDVSGAPYAPPKLDVISQITRNSVVGSSHRDLKSVTESVTRDGRLAHSIATTGEACVEAGAHMGNQEMVKYLLDQGVPYSLPTAVMRGDFKRVESLLDQDPLRIHERGAHDFALLWYPIIGQCDLEMTKLLLDRGANVERQHFLGTTALHWACMRGPIELIQLLIDHGADVNRRGRKFGPEGETPLETSKESRRPEIVALLKKHGAEG